MYNNYNNNNNNNGNHNNDNNNIKRLAEAKIRDHIMYHQRERKTLILTAVIK